MSRTSIRAPLEHANDDIVGSTLTASIQRTDSIYTEVESEWKPTSGNHVSVINESDNESLRTCGRACDRVEYAGIAVSAGVGYKRTLNSDRIKKSENGHIKSGQ
jgi:hypothetical protein